MTPFSAPATDEAPPEIADAYAESAVSIPLLKKPAPKRVDSVDLLKLDRVPPHSIEAEQGVLGCVLLSPTECLGLCLEKVKAGAKVFYDLRHQTLFEHLVLMYDAKQPIDLITVQQRLKDANQLEGVGGLAYLSGLMDAVPSAANLAYYLDIVREKHVLRRMLQTCTQVLGRVHEHEGKVDALLDEVTHDILRIGQERVTTGRGRWPKPISAADWIKPENKPAVRPEIITGLLRRGDKLVLGGGSKSCKTWFAASLAISIAAGKPFLGFRTVKTPALFINLELPDDVMWDRMARLFLENQINPADCDIQIWNLRGNRDLSIEKLDAQLSASAIKAGFIVLDPLYKLLGDRSENDAAEMTSLFQIIEGIAHRMQAAVLIPAHYSKGNQSEKSAIDRISGSGAIARDADALITMTTHEEEDAFTMDFTLRAYAPVPSFAVRWEYPLFTRDDNLDPEKLKLKSGRPKFDSEQFLSLFPDHGLTTSDLIDAAKARFKLSRTSCYRMQKELLEDGKLSVVPGSNPTRYSKTRKSTLEPITDF